MLKQIILLLLLVTTVLADMLLYPTAYEEASICFDCPSEANHCFLFKLMGKQACLKESIGSTIQDTCSSQDTFFDFKNNNYTTKLEYQSGKCNVVTGVAAYGTGRTEPFCQATNKAYIDICFYPLEKSSTSNATPVSPNSATPPSIDTIAVTSSANGLKVVLPCLILTLLPILTFIF